MGECLGIAVRGGWGKLPIMPKYRIYLTDGRQLDVDAADHFTHVDEKKALARVEFKNTEGRTVASFTAPALMGFIEIERLISQKGD